MGSEDVRTPHLDALAAESRVFTRGYVPTALCRASLATLITGLYPHEHKLTGNDPPRGVERARMLEHIEAVETVADHLGAAGYRSLQTGKWWEGNCTCGGFTEGMTHGDPSRGGRHGDEGLRIGRDGMAPATDFIDACVEDEAPFFLWYAPLLPHTPHDPPERLLATYRAEDVPLPIARYRAMCTLFDETCGELLGHLRERGVADDTLVLFVVDNGWIQRPNGRGYAPRSKRTPYEGGVRTPIMVRWTGRVAPGRVETPVSSVDVPATILAACGLDAGALGRRRSDGRRLGPRPALRRGVHPRRRRGRPARAQPPLPVGARGPAEAHRPHGPRGPRSSSTCGPIRPRSGLSRTGRWPRGCARGSTPGGPPERRPGGRSAAAESPDGAPSLSTAAVSSAHAPR